MIDKIGVHQVNQIKTSKPEETKPAFKGNEDYPQIAELKGSELMANYSVAFINKVPKEKFALKEIPLINAETDMSKIEGERIYASNGELNSIVVDDENTTTIYSPSKVDSDFVGYISVIDNATGKKILAQENWKEKTGCSQYVYAYSTDGEKELVESSSYEDGQFLHSWKDSKKGDRTETLTHWGRDYSLTVSDKQIFKRVDFDKEGNLTEIITTKKFPNGELTQSVGILDGELYKAGKEKQFYFKKFDASEIFADDNFKPAERFSTKKFLAKDLMAEGFDGEKTYYSNGAIESLTTKLEDIEAKISFTPQGEMKSIEANSKILSYDDYNNEEIFEKLGENETRETKYIKETNEIRVCHDLDGFKRTVWYDSEGAVSAYSEETADGDKTMSHVNEEGFIIETFSYNTNEK